MKQQLLFSQNAH